LILYLDSSVLVRTVVRQPEPLDGWERWEALCSSALLGVEVRRSLYRLRLQNALDDDGLADAHSRLTFAERRIQTLPVSRAVLRRASMPTPGTVKTLDAIHLASAMLYEERLGERPVFATHDRQLALAATALGFDTIGV
jgi:predicted nucleic acid-binding protein